MRKQAVVAGLAVVMMACGGGDKSATPATDSVPAAPAPAAATGATHDINMVLEGTAYKFVPAEFTIKVGDQVVFHNVSGGPHNVKFWEDSIPAGAKEVLAPQIKDGLEPLSTALETEPNATITLSFAGAPVGVYSFTCVPHQAMGMHGKVTVTQ